MLLNYSNRKKHQHLAFVLHKFHVTDVFPKLQSIQIPLQRHSCPSRVNRTFQFHIISKLAKGIFNSCIQIIDRNFKQNPEP